MLIKSRLIDEITQQLPQLPEKDIALSVNAILELMSTALSEGERIEVRGFGSFSVRYRPPRKAHNPKTGEKLVTRPKYVVHFKPGKELREQVDASQHIPLQTETLNDNDDD